MSQKLQAQLEKRAKELDAREEYLNQWESELKSGPIDLKVLKESIKARQTQLNGLTRAVNEAESKLRELKRQRDKAEVDNKARQLQLNAELNRLDDQISDKKADLKQARSIYNDLEKEIGERKAYLRQQEQLIADKVEEGNTTLVNLQAEIRDFEGQRQIAEEELGILNTSKDDILFEQQRYSEEANTIKLGLQAEEQELHKTLDKLNNEIGVAQAKLNKTNQDVDEKLKQLKLKEEELMAKRDAVNNDRLQLEEDKRRWNSTKSLYQL